MTLPHFGHRSFPVTDRPDGDEDRPKIITMKIRLQRIHRRRTNLRIARAGSGFQEGAFFGGRSLFADGCIVSSLSASAKNLSSFVTIRSPNQEKSARPSPPLHTPRPRGITEQQTQPAPMGGRGVGVRCFCNQEPKGSSWPFVWKQVSMLAHLFSCLHKSSGQPLWAENPDVQYSSLKNLAGGADNCQEKRLIFRIKIFNLGHHQTVDSFHEPVLHP